MEITKEEKDLIKELLKKYENKVYMGISQKENKWLFDLINKFN